MTTSADIGSVSTLEREPFSRRHIGPDEADIAAMLKVVGAPSLDALIDEAIPRRIRLPQPLNLPDGQPEHEFLVSLAEVAATRSTSRSSVWGTTTASRRA
jgi:glycine dehydrogenase